MYDISNDNMLVIIIYINILEKHEVDGKKFIRLAEKGKKCMMNH